jgi:hypothetical protein
MMMNKNILNIFKIDELWVEHSLDIDSDTTYFKTLDNVDSNEYLMYVKYDCEIYIHGSDSPLGRFELSSTGLWNFKFYNEVECVVDKVISTGNKNLMKAAMKIFKKLVEMKIINL